jgi:hypothetical protein
MDLPPWQLEQGLFDLDSMRGESGAARSNAAANTSIRRKFLYIEHKSQALALIKLEVIYAICPQGTGER